MCSQCWNHTHVQLAGWAEQQLSKARQCRAAVPAAQATQSSRPSRGGAAEEQAQRPGAHSAYGMSVMTSPSLQLGLSFQSITPRLRGGWV